MVMSNPVGSGSAAAGMVTANPTDEHWMRQALECARGAAGLGEVPVGAVVVAGDECLARGWNRPITEHDPTAHAEIVALRGAALRRRNYRLPGTTLYVTLEPCPMCVGAMIHARIGRLVFAAHDPRSGAAGSAFRLLQSPRHNHRVQTEGGLLEHDSAALLRAFFRARRER